MNKNQDRLLAGEVCLRELACYVTSPTEEMLSAHGVQTHETPPHTVLWVQKSRNNKCFHLLLVRSLSHPILHSDPCTWDSQAWLFPLARTKITPCTAPSGPNLLRIACWAAQVTVRWSHSHPICWPGPCCVRWLSFEPQHSEDARPSASVVFCSSCFTLAAELCSKHEICV